MYMETATVMYHSVAIYSLADINPSSQTAIIVKNKKTSQIPPLPA